MRGKVDTTLFRREVNKDFIIVQIYVYDIILELLINLCASTSFI